MYRKSTIAVACMSFWVLGSPTFAGCLATPPKAGTREAIFAQQVVERTPTYLEALGVPGAAVAIIEDGKVILARGFGMANTNKGIPVREQTLFNIGSTSKSVAAWGAMHLVRDGKLTLDDPVEPRLKRWHLPASSHPVNGVTLRRLLSHTAGLSVDGYRGWGPDDIIPTLEQSLSGQTNGAGAVALVRDPGTKMAYSVEATP